MSGCEEVVLALPDLNGRLVGTRLGAGFYEEQAAHAGFGACTYLLATDVDMQVVAPGSLDPEGTGFGDLVLHPDASTRRPLPWDPGTDLVLVDARTPEGALVDVAPRTALRAQVDALAEHGLVPFAGVELELRVFEGTVDDAAARGWTGLVPATRGNVDYALTGQSRMDRLTRRLRREMSAAGLRLESARGECAPGQYEIVFRYDEALRAADDAAFYKLGAQQVAEQEGLALTFMPKPDAHEGSSCHLHVSLRDLDGAPVLAGDGPHGESALLRRVLAGQLACLRELSLLFAPSVNAWKRLRPGAFAPTAVSWGVDDRLAALRLVGRGPSLRLEHRVPGGDASPHLALAGVLLAARHGLEADLPLPDPVRGAPPATAPRLPRDLDEAADLLDGSEVARKGLGDALVDALVARARHELALAAAAVTDWERRRSF